MTYTRPGRLYRLLPTAVPRPLFSFYSPSLSLYDEEISGVTITRGQDSRTGEVSPTVLELDAPGTVVPVNGEICRFFLRETAAAALGPIVSKTGDEIMHRFQGRMGAVTVEDHGNRTSSNFGASSYTAQLLQSPRASQALAGQTVKRVIQDMFHLLDGGVISGISVEFAGDYDTVPRTVESGLFSDYAGKFAGDLGIMIRETRDGRQQVLPHDYRRQLAIGPQLSSMPHLTRWQTVAPATWQQSNESPAARLDYQVTNENGNVVTRTAELDQPWNTVETLTADWSYIQPTTDQLFYEAYGRVYARSTRQFRLPEVKVDILRLITSPYAYDRLQAGNLLALEVGDPVMLAADWDPRIEGVHFAQGIKETITGDAWEMTLQLHPMAHVLGAVSPTVPARVWAAARGPWSADTRTWGAA